MYNQTVSASSTTENTADDNLEQKAMNTWKKKGLAWGLLVLRVLAGA